MFSCLESNVTLTTYLWRWNVPICMHIIYTFAIKELIVHIVVWNFFAVCDTTEVSLFVGKLDHYQF